MISGVRGTVAATAGDLVTVETASGISYDLAVPLGVLERLPKPGKPVYLHTVLVVREDAWSLFGFDSRTERTVFERLLAATGVGPRLALALLSALGSERVIRAIRDNDLAVLCSVPGVGKKKAERMVLELRDRIRDLEVEGRPAGGSAADQAVTALVNLGYPAMEADRAVRAILAADAPAATSVVIRRALETLSKGP